MLLTYTEENMSVIIAGVERTGLMSVGGHDLKAGAVQCFIVEVCFYTFQLYQIASASTLWYSKVTAEKHLLKSPSDIGEVCLLQFIHKQKIQWVI